MHMNLAYTIVNAKNDLNWAWFCKTLHEKVILSHALQFIPLIQVIFLSDHQKSLLETIYDMFPNNAHDYCLHHLEENFHKQFKNAELKSFLWQAACAVSEVDYDIALENILSINSKCIKWLIDHVTPFYWAEIYLQDHHYSHLISNKTESLNTGLKEVHEMLILLEKIHHQLME